MLPQLSSPHRLRVRQRITLSMQLRKTRFLRLNWKLHRQRLRVLQLHSHNSRVLFPRCKWRTPTTALRWAQ